MSSVKICIAAATLCIWLGPSHVALGQAPAASGKDSTRDRARIVLSEALPKMNGEQLKEVLLEVRYGPGEASSPHRHPCAVIAYVVEGAIRTQVQGEPERVYQAGESFYEAPNGVHLVSANASATQPAKFLAYLLCDHDAPLSVDVPENVHPQGRPQ